MNIEKKKNELEKSRKKRIALEQKEAKLLKTIKTEEEKKAKLVRDTLGKEMMKTYPELVQLEVQEISNFVNECIRIEFHKNDNDTDASEKTKEDEITNSNEVLEGKEIETNIENE